MAEAIEYFLNHGGLVGLAVFLVPGFVAWRTYQWRRPQGEQKAADAVVDIITFGVITNLIWFWRVWTAWPADIGQALQFAAEIFVTPILVALVYQLVVEQCAARNWITSPHPRAWDYVFNALATDTNGPGKHGLFLIVTTKAGDKLAGVYSDPGFVSLWPYDRDLLLGQVWQLENGRPARIVAGSIGLYIDGASIEAIELFDYRSVLQSVTRNLEGTVT